MKKYNYYYFIIIMKSKSFSNLFQDQSGRFIHAEIGASRRVQENLVKEFH